jgi:ABC-type branched-subunit amino acid transport system substrate-binding protein
MPDVPPPPATRTTPPADGSRLRRLLRWWFPSATAWPPLPWWKRIRGYLAITAVLALVVGGFWAGAPLAARVRCGQFSVSADIWYEGGECVGISDGSYTFGSQFGPVMQKIKALNHESSCEGTGNPVTPVTVGALVTLTSLNAGIRAVHELEGFAAALYETRRRGGDLSVCTHPIHLLIAQAGANEQAATQDARLLAGRHVVAVVGMGLSNQQSADAAAILDHDQIPMVADVITAEGFDQNGSRADRPDFGSCTLPSQGGQGPRGDYEHGLGDYFFRVAFRAKVQAASVLAELASVARPRQLFVVQPTDTTDPYTCTALPLIIGGLSGHAGAPTPKTVDFSPGQQDTTQSAAAMEVCSRNGRVTVFYGARAVDLSTFLDDVILLRQRGECNPRSVTVLSMSDAAQLRVTAPNANLEAVRRDVLTAAPFTSGWIRMLYTPLADPDLLRAHPPAGYLDLTDGLRHDGFATQDLDDGWAIMAYDALATVASALQRTGSGVTGSQVQAFIQDAPSPVPGADGPVAFDNAGNRVGAGPGVVRLCPFGGPPGDPVTTVPVRPGKPANCPAGRPG